MLLLSCVALVSAIQADGFRLIPSDMIMPIVTNIESFRDLCALNMTNKAFYPVIRPIFEFASACQVISNQVWPNDLLEIRTDSINSPATCANHLMQYSYLYKRISIYGSPVSVAELFSQVSIPIQSPVDVMFRAGSLNYHTLTDIIDSINVGSVSLDFFRQTVDSRLVNVLTTALDRRINLKSPIYGVLMDGNDQIMPLNLLQNFFGILPHSDLKRLTISGPLYNNSIFQLSAVMPRSKLNTFECIHSASVSDEELKALGVALVNTPTMKNILFRYLDSSNVLVESMIPGLNISKIEQLEITYGNNMDVNNEMDAAVSLLTVFPTSLKVLNLAGNSLNATTILNLVAAVSQSNVQKLNLLRNYAQLNTSSIQKIADLIVGSKLKVLNVADNGIDAEDEDILRRAVDGIKIIIHSFW